MEPDRRHRRDHPPSRTPTMGVTNGARKIASRIKGRHRTSTTIVTSSPPGCGDLTHGTAVEASPSPLLPIVEGEDDDHSARVLDPTNRTPADWPSRRSWWRSGPSSPSLGSAPFAADRSVLDDRSDPWPSAPRVRARSSSSSWRCSRHGRRSGLPTCDRRDAGGRASRSGGAGRDHGGTGDGLPRRPPPRRSVRRRGRAGPRPAPSRARAPSAPRPG